MTEEKFFDGEKLFMLYDTHGLPLEISIEKILEADVLIRWPEFILAACRAGWSNKKIKNTIFYALDDVSGHKEYKKRLKNKLETYLC
jgi:alanyl-tRNA synthetase